MVSRYPYFTEEHEMFRKTVRDFVQKELAPHAEEWDKAEEFPRDVFKRMGELGFLGIRYPEEYGGSGLDYFYSVVFAEELVGCGLAGLVMSVLVQSDMGTGPLHLIGSDEMKRKYLAPAIRGEMIAALGITEPGAGSDVASMLTMAVRDGDEYVINGTKIFITNGTRADFITLAAKTDKEAGHGGISMFVAPTDLPGFSVGRKLDKVGNRVSDTAELIFEDYRIPAANLLGEEGQGFYTAMINFQGERLIAAIASVAGAQRMLDMTLEYAQQRVQFGRPIAKFQVTRHKFAEMATEIEAARQLAYHGAYLIDKGIECVKEVSMAKLFCCETAFKVVDRCLQIHGGYGYMNEYPVSRAWRDTRLSTIGGGTSEVMKEIIGRLMGC
ncbi:MAG: acyl-CoA dehydrogenase family protein [Candidatus Hydrogenedentota bacterium]|nr:MAG: acyl-CoA dehydrogenase family protein [Candidatus Hydrogenedentota bacterium]